jgi:large subunit ribosomal protein L31e
MKEMGTSDIHIDSSLNKAIWAKGIRDALHGICLVQICLSRKHNEAGGGGPRL